MSEDPSDWDYKPKDWDFEQQQSPQEANSEVTELEALRLELHELKEEIKNKPQITSSNIAEGVAEGIIRVIGTFVMLYLVYLGFMFIVFLGAVITSTIENKPSNPPVISPSP